MCTIGDPYNLLFKAQYRVRRDCAGAVPFDQLANGFAVFEVYGQKQPGHQAQLLMPEVRL